MVLVLVPHLAVPRKEVTAATYLPSSGTWKWATGTRPPLVPSPTQRKSRREQPSVPSLWQTTVPKYRARSDWPCTTLASSCVLRDRLLLALVRQLVVRIKTLSWPFANSFYCCWKFIQKLAKYERVVTDVCHYIWQPLPLAMCDLLRRTTTTTITSIRKSTSNLPCLRLVVAILVRAVALDPPPISDLRLLVL